ncbi:MAG: hypothetical protein ACJAYJ_002867 [Saprospiraceae bacterium]|jgi:hypothetical protein
MKMILQEILFYPQNPTRAALGSTNYSAIIKAIY